jgi:hypothetical protein
MSVVFVLLSSVCAGCKPMSVVFDLYTLDNKSNTTDMGLHPADTLDNKSNTTDMGLHPAQAL